MRHPFFSLPSLACLSVAVFVAPVCLAVPAAAVNTCPVELSAGQHPGSVLVPAEQIQPDDHAILPPKMPAGEHTLDFSMKNTRLQRIVAAELAVHGTLNKSAIMPTHATTATVDGNARATAAGSQAEATRLVISPNSDVVRYVHLTSSVPADQERSNVLSVHELTTVTSISVIELRYADGSTWHAGAGRPCNAGVSGVMLIAGK
jgi:hypothetical protein